MFYNKAAKRKALAITAEIRRVLMTHWDPIGVADVPEAADEYDMYLGGVFGLLQPAASDETITKHLRDIELESMGLTDEHGNPFASDESRKIVVAELQRLRALF